MEKYMILLTTMAISIGCKGNNDLDQVCVDSLLQPCGHLTCNVSYQYCDIALMNRPTCFLCSDMCEPLRIGNNPELNIECYKKCPVYMERVNCKATLNPLLTTTESPSSTDAVSWFYFTLWFLVSIVLVLSIVVVLLVLLLINEKRKREIKDKKRSIVTPKCDIECQNPLLQPNHVHEQCRRFLQNSNECSRDTVRIETIENGTGPSVPSLGTYRSREPPSITSIHSASSRNSHHTRRSIESQTQMAEIRPSNHQQTITNEQRTDTGNILGTPHTTNAADTAFTHANTVNNGQNYMKRDTFYRDSGISTSDLNQTLPKHGS